jgi:DNA-directed RNA polymerase specialized sigma24 family protein
MEPRQAEFAAVFEEHFDYVYRIVSGFFRQSEDVEDIVAETFMQLWQMWDDVEQEKLKQSFPAAGFMTCCARSTKFH